MKKNKKDEKNKRKKDRLLNIIIVVTFVLGVAILLYPVVTRFYYRVESTRVISDFDEGKKELSKREIDKKISLAKAYNASLGGNVTFVDPYVNNIEEGVKSYARMLEVREKIGVLKIPSISSEEPIYAGTSDEVLEKGIGHMEYTSLPVGGKGTHTVLTGHRGLPTAKIFTDLNKVKIGEVFYIENVRNTLAYKVVDKKIIEPSNFSDLMIDPSKDKCTLLTCHPYMINSHRLLIIAERTRYNPSEYKKNAEEGHRRRMIKIALILLGVMIFAIIIYLLFRRKKKRKSLSNLLRIKY